jgi:D-sedoheptulose 7-phosphate isomerase
MSDATDFLYPFIEGDEHDAGTLVADLGRSAVAKGVASGGLQTATLARERAVIEEVAGRMAACFGAGGTLFTFGNGGSCTDAASMAALYSRPPDGRAVPARCLAEDTAVITAIANDVGFDLVFSRQLIAHASAGDIALGISTSGNSRNLLEAFGEAQRRGLLTVGMAGYDGGAMATDPSVAYCLVVAADSVHRVQETQAAIGYALWRAVQERLA